jgi:hypothetical protein
MGCYDGGGSNKSLFGAKNLQIGVKSMWYDGGDKKMEKRKIIGRTWLETSTTTIPRQRR